MSMPAKKVLITGALGYLGGRLTVALTEAGVQVTGVTSRLAEEPAGWPSGATLQQINLRAGLEVEQLMGFDAVVHLAAPNEIDCERDPDAALIDTAVLTRRLLEVAIKAGVPRFIFLSTIHTYGSPLEGVLNEDRAVRPVHPYAISHRAAEDYVLAAHQQRRIDGIVVRLSNGIGAPAWPSIDRWTLLGNDLARQLVSTGSMTMRSSGVQWREFVTIPDFCSGISVLLRADRADLGDGLFNMGGGAMLRIIDVVQTMADVATDVLGTKPKITRPETTEPELPPPFTFPTDKLARLGFEPTGSRFLKGELEATLRLLL